MNTEHYKAAAERTDETSTQQGEQVLTDEQLKQIPTTKFISSTMEFAPKKQGKIERDWEPEMAYGTAHDFKEHTRFGGTRDDY